MHIHYAIGDIHGRDDLLERTHERIVADHQLRHGDAPAVIVYVGDYIDRGANSAGVIDRVMRGVPGFESVCLKGNHEQWMLDCLVTDDRYVWSPWLENGGQETLDSLGVAFRRRAYDPLVLARALGSKRLGWLDKLKLYYRAGDYVFVHAGIVPGRPLDEQEEKDLLWIRRAFLDSDEDPVSVSFTATHRPKSPSGRPTASASIPARPGTASSRRSCWANPKALASSP
jgi:serine/threonine protein phosphatase 1